MLALEGEGRVRAASMQLICFGFFPNVTKNQSAWPCTSQVSGSHEATGEEEHIRANYSIAKGEQTKTHAQEVTTEVIHICKKQKCHYDPLQKTRFRP